MYTLVLIVMTMINGVDTDGISVHSISGFNSKGDCEMSKKLLRQADDFYKNSYSIQDATCVYLGDI